MAEPQATPQSSSQTDPARAKANAGQTSEARTFDGGQREREEAQFRDQAAHPIIEGGRQALAEGRRAGQQVGEAWRQALDPFLAMQYDMSRWFDDVLRQTFGFRGGQTTHAFRPLAHFAPASLFGLPAADLRETETAHLISVELPGLKAEDLDLSVQGDNLVICGHKAEETDDATAAWRVSERRFGRFERAFPLPPDADRPRIEAQFNDGLLKITVPKTAGAAAKTSKIQIRT